MNEDLIEFKTCQKPTNLMKSIINDSIVFNKFVRGMIFGKVCVLYSQGFMSKPTYERYLALIGKAEDSTLKLRKRGINKWQK